MALRPDPLKELLDLQERMNRLFDQTLSRERVDDPGFAPSWVPVADVYETPEVYILEIELPGLTRDEVRIDAKGNKLTVRGVRQSAGGRSAAFHRLERRYGQFARTFRFGDALDPEYVKAELNDGLLRVEARRLPADAARVVRVERS
jgi:HSP20 family protein